MDHRWITIIQVTWSSNVFKNNFSFIFDWFKYKYEKWKISSKNDYDIYLLKSSWFEMI